MIPGSVPPLRIIHDPAQGARRAALDAQIAGIPHELWPAVFAADFKTGCAEAHKGIVRHLLATGAPYGIIGEDDLAFTAPGAWRHFLDGLAQLPEDWDIYLGGIHWHRILHGALPGRPLLRTVQGFTGMHLYAVSAKCYTRLLAAPAGLHLDMWLGQQDIHAYLCWPLAAIQAPGYSANQKRDVDYSHLFGRYELWRGP